MVLLDAEETLEDDNPDDKDAEASVEEVTVGDEALDAAVATV